MMMRRPVLPLFAAAILPSLLLACIPKTGRDPSVLPTNGGKLALKTVQVKPKRVEGGRFPAVRPNLFEPLNEEENRFIVPDGPRRGKLRPANRQSTPR